MTAMAASTPCSSSADRPRRPGLSRAVPFLALALVALLASACERNVAETLLVPTGMRPPLANPAGAVTGYVFWAPQRFPDLADPPYPPTIVELVSSGSVIGRDTIGGGRRTFLFEGVQPGTYTVRAQARGFLVTSVTGVRVAERPVDAGDVTLRIDATAYSVFVGIIGTMPGFDYDSYFLNLMDQPSTGIFTTIFPATVSAGTYRFKFVTDPSFPDDLIGWGGDSTVVRAAPLSQLPTTFGSGPARDLKVSFATGGSFNFVLDERRQTFSIVPVTAQAAAGTGRPR